MEKFKEGQKVQYEGKDTHIEVLRNDGTCVIANPYWDYDEEGLCISENLEYDIPYWITVNISELNEILN